MTKHEVKEREKDAPAQEQQGGAVVAAGNKAVVDYGSDVGSGFQNQTKDDYSVPFIDILQPGSPEVLEAGKGGARAGDIINRVTGEIWSGEEGIAFVGAITEHCYTEWRPKIGPNGEQLKGGFVARHDLDSEWAKQAKEQSPFKKHRLPNGNDLMETYYVFGPQVFEGGMTAPIGIPFASTKIKAYKNWTYVARAIQVPNGRGGRDNPPLYAHVYRMTTKMRKEGQNTWFVPVISFDGKDAESCRLLPDDPIYLSAKAIMLAHDRGELKADYSKTTDDTPAAAESSKAPF